MMEVTFLENLPRWASYYLIAFFLCIEYILIIRLLKHDFKKYSKEEDLSHNCNTLMFEYQELREERNRNTTMNYQIMAILIGAVFVVLSQWSNVIILSLKEPLIILMVVTLGGVLFIDRRLMFFNNLRVERMKVIERELNIYNLFLTDENVAKFGGVRPRLYNNISIHHVFLLIILVLISLLIHLYIDPQRFLSLSSEKGSDIMNCLKG